MPDPKSLNSYSDGKYSFQNMFKACSYNFMDYLDIELVMNKLSEKIHKIAHISPLDADRFRDFNALYGFRTIYGTIEGQ